MKDLMTAGLALALLGGLAGCAETPPLPGPPGPDVVEAEGERDLAPAVPPADAEALVAGNARFALELYRSLRGGEGNLFFSPHSISSALAMTYAGARGETESQMASALRFALPQGRLHPAFNALDLALASRGEGAQGKDGEGFRLNVVNALWGQRDYRFLPQFLDVLAASYGAGLRVLDFASSPEESRGIINDWVSERTEGRIEDLIAPGMIGSQTQLVLTNAIYFNAAWAHPFQEEATQDGPFHLLDGSQVSAPTMSQRESFGYVRGDGFQAVELPYDGRELSMVLLVPDQGQFQEFEEGLNAGVVEDVVNGLAPRQIALTMPKFKMESEFSLGDTLAAMGMPAAFSEGADFSGMTGGRDLFISAVIHKAFVEVDEAGTEAAAATAVVMRLTSMPAEPVEVRVDRPFLFLIRDVETGALLFLGRVVDPTA